MQAAGQRARIRIVQSRQNARLKELRAAFSHPPAAGGEGPIAIEGEHLLLEALRSGLPLETVFLRSGSEALLDRLPIPVDADVVELPPELFNGAVPTEHPQGVAALLQPPAFAGADVFGRAGTPLVLILAGLQDPGNLGTLLRSGEAFGATGVLALPGTVNRWNPKSLRASSGSAFRMPFVQLSEHGAFGLLEEHGVAALAAVARGGVAAEHADLKRPVALLIGNEGAGLSPSLVSRAGGRITLRCPGPVESLNAAVAASLLVYEASRQRAEASRQPAERHGGGTGAD